jgi:aminoglycoside phosphotransferase (APT) family kinase protein
LENDVALTRAIAQTIMRRHRSFCVVESVEPRHGGGISTVYEMRCSNPDQRVILKVYPDTFHWKMEKEVYVYNLLNRDEGLPTPSILGSDDSKALLPQNYVLMTTLQGHLLSHVAPSLSALQLRDIYFQMGTLLAKVHDFALDAFGYITSRVIAAHATNEAYMRFQFQKKLAELEAHGGDASLRHVVEAYLARHGDLLTHAQTPVLCHDDYHEGNVLVAEEEGHWRVTGIIDVENAVAGDPLLDIAKTDYYAIKAHAAKREGFLAGYGRLPVHWHDRVQLYKLYHALELWDWFAALGNTAAVLRITEDLQRFSAV